MSIEQLAETAQVMVAAGKGAGNPEVKIKNWYKGQAGGKRVPSLLDLAHHRERDRREHDPHPEPARLSLLVEVNVGGETQKSGASLRLLGRGL